MLVGITIRPVTISPNLIEQGEVKKYVIFSTKDHKTEVAMLELSPKAKIKRHRHTDEMEIYFFVEQKYATTCNDGEEHELVNVTDKVLRVISIKLATKKREKSILN